MTLRDASELLYPAVCESVAALGLGSEDAAAVKLAKQYARTIDEAPPGREYYTRLRWLGPELDKTLAALGATPVARSAMKKAEPKAPDRENKLAKLRSASLHKPA